MATISILKKLINFYFYFLVLIFIGIAILLPILYKKGEDFGLNLIDGYDFSTLSFGEFLTVILICLGICYLYIRAVYLIKKCLNSLSNGDYFSKLTTHNFNKAGKLFIISGISFSVFKFILRLVLLNDVKVGLNNTLILSLIIGLFFMFLSEVFTQARETKKENDLTI
ncbi:DUF2975 domain-containing protein [Polaribacter sp.]|uniref:DUF2975 domain-containing protein n=1 Tax=Polaribacter sp. TaxID=1920175 RepID=UPI003F6970B2